MTRGICVALMLAALIPAAGSVLSCGMHIPGLRSATTPPAPKLPDAKGRARRPTPPPSFYWEAIDPDVRTPSRKPLDLPVAETAVNRVEGGTRVWDDLAPEARERLRRDGALVVSSEQTAPAPPARNAAAKSIGAFYTDLREQRIPHLITLDALFALVHLGLGRALAEVEEQQLVPALHALLEKLDQRLGKEAGGVGTELAEGYRVAHGAIAVARALEATPSAPYVAPAELAAVVAEEKSRIEAAGDPQKLHAKASPSTTAGALMTSPLLGVPLDYSRFAVPSTTVAHPNSFRAFAWLAAVPFTLVARSEAPGSPISVAQARTNTRAAMLLARLCDREVDPAIHASYTHMLKLLAFVWGAPDDLSLSEIDDLSYQAQIDLRKPENIANVTRVDKMRARALTGRAPAVYDGSGGAFRGGISARVFGGHASADSLAMQALVGAPVGLAQETAAAATIDRLRKGMRVLPSTLDVVAWLGAPEARGALRETHADAFDGYDAALAGAQRTRPSDQSVALHASVHGSLIDALIAWANPSDTPIMKTTPAADRRRVESMLSAWTLVRHLGLALAQPKQKAGALPTELRVSGNPLPVFVEPLPDVVARLVAAVRQMRRGLEALAPLPPTSHAMTMLVEIEDILKVALKGAERHSSDEALTTEEASALASLPARITRVEEAMDPEQLGPVVAVVYSDPTARRVLVSATGRIEPLLTFAREPGKDELLVVGAHVAHHELVVAEGSPGSPVTDASWRSRVKLVPAAAKSGASPAGPAGPGVPGHAAWTAAFRWPPVTRGAQ